MLPTKTKFVVVLCINWTTKCFNILIICVIPDLVPMVFPLVTLIISWPFLLLSVLFWPLFRKYLYKVQVWCFFWGFDVFVCWILALGASARKVSREVSAGKRKLASHQKSRMLLPPLIILLFGVSTFSAGASDMTTHNCHYWQMRVAVHFYYYLH